MTSFSVLKKRIIRNKIQSSKQNALNCLTTMPGLRFIYEYILLKGDMNARWVHTFGFDAEDFRGIYL